MPRKRVMYLRDADGNPTRGVMVAVEVEPKYLRFGMVRYHPTKENIPYTKKRAKKIAFDRAEKCTFLMNPTDYPTEVGRTHVIPEKYTKQAKYFMIQALERLEANSFQNVLF